MKKAWTDGILGAFFFAFTFLLNRSMDLAGGYWLWSACLRYVYTLPILAMLLWRGGRMAPVLAELRARPAVWLLWSTVGFGLFYAPLTLASSYGESWLIAASWQITIVAGVLLSPLFGHGVPVKNLAMSCLILAGVALLQSGHRTSAGDALTVLAPILVAAFAYPLGNRKMMQHCPPQLDAMQRTFGMTLCSMPFWLVCGAAAWWRAGLPSRGQQLQSLLVALFSGVIATCLFFRATDRVKGDHRQLAVVEATQSGEVVFTLLGGILLLGDRLPTAGGFAGIALIVLGMVGNSLVSR